RRRRHSFPTRRSSDLCGPLPVSGFLTRYSRVASSCCSLPLGSVISPNTRALEGQVSTHAGISPRSTRCTQNVHFSTTPLSSRKKDRKSTRLNSSQAYL